MTRHLSFYLAAIRHSGRNYIRSLKREETCTFASTSTSVLGKNFTTPIVPGPLCGNIRTGSVLINGSRSIATEHFCSTRLLSHFTKVSSYNSTTTTTTWRKRIPQMQMRQALDFYPYFYGRGRTALGSIVNRYDSKPFTTSAIHENRSNKGSLGTPGLGESKYSSKRKRSSNSIIGQIANNANTFDFIDNKRTRLKFKETKQKISKGVRSIRSNIYTHNKKLRENLQLQKAKKNGIVRSLKRQLDTKTKKENIKTIPNLLTTLRMASAPLLSYLVVSDYYGCALSIFVLAGMSDMLDGYIARNFKNQRTAFGTALDPLADKLLISFLTVSLTVNGLIPVPLTVLILGRDAGLVIASFYIRYISLAPPRTLARYFDFSHVTAKIYPSNISKINTAVQLSFVACTLAAPVFDFVDSPWLQLLMYTTAATTFLSGADYMLTWRRRLKIIKNT